MKKILIMILIASSFTLFANDQRASKVITAYKRSMLGSVPEMELHFRLLDSNDLEFDDGYNLNLPMNARNTAYNAFSWVLSGNAYRSVTVKFSFFPMYNEGDSQTTEIIPYDVNLRHIQTRIGNTQIPVNRPSESVSYLSNNFTDYRYQYADKVTESVSISVTNSSSAQVASIDYDMSTYTKVYDIQENLITSSYPYDVCNFYNRQGEAIITLKISANAEKLDTNRVFQKGTYYAVVRAEVIVN